MANKFQIKRTTVGGRQPNTTSSGNSSFIDVGELALNLTDKKLFSSNGSALFEIGANLVSLSVTANTTANNLNITGALAFSGNVGSANQIAISNGSGVSWGTFPGVAVYDQSNTLLTTLYATVATNIDSLSDVDTSSSPPSDGDVLTWNSSASQWKPLTGSSGSRYVLTGTTTNSTETELFVNGVANTRVSIPTNSTYFYTVDIVGKRTDVVGDYAAFVLKSVITNVSGNTSDVGSVYETIVVRTNNGLAVDSRANNTTDTLNIFVTGVAAQTYSWKAVVTYVEV